MKITNKLRMLAILPVTLAVLVAGTVFHSARRIDNARRRENAAESMVKDVFELDGLAHRYLYQSEFGADRPRQQWLSKHKDLAAKLSEMNAPNAKDQPLLNQMHEEHKQIDGLFRRLIANREELAGASDEKTEFLQIQKHDLVRRLLDHTLSFREASSDLADSSRRAADATQRTANLLVLVFLAASVPVLLLVTGLFVARSITRPIQALADATQTVSAEHDYSIRVEKHSNDELGVLCDGFNSMLDQIQQQESDLASSNAELDKTVSQQRTMLEQLQQREAELQQANDELDRTIQGVHEAVGQLAAMSEELTATIAQQSSGVQDQAAAINQTVTTVKEIAETSDRASEQVKSVGDAAQETLEVGEAGRQAVADSMSAMETVSEQAELTAGNILSLAEKAQAIGEITQTVNDIAEQTNVLALNAAVEASRAGEHGKGFSAVASEVKRLAQQSKEATEQVRQILREILQATNTAVLSTEQGTKSVDRARSVVTQAGTTIDALANALDETSRKTAQIVASANQQAQGMDQVNRAMHDIDRATQQQVSAVRQVEQTAEHLVQLSRGLSELITEHELTST